MTSWDGGTLAEREYLIVRGTVQQIVYYNDANGYAVPVSYTHLITPIAIEEGLRFAIREGGRTVGSGVVTAINARCV